MGVEPLLHEEVDMPEIDITEVDRDLLRVAGLGAKLIHVVGHFHHPVTISVDGISGWHPWTSRASACESGTPPAGPASRRTEHRYSVTPLWAYKLVRRRAGSIPARPKA